MGLATDPKGTGGRVGRGFGAAVLLQEGKEHQFFLVHVHLHLGAQRAEHVRQSAERL